MPLLPNGIPETNKAYAAIALLVEKGELAWQVLGYFKMSFPYLPLSFVC
jgi:hypothetical protein